MLGLNVLEDVVDGANLKESFNTRMRESGVNLKRKAEDKLTRMMEGSGYKKLPSTRKRQYRKSRARARNTAGRKKKKAVKKAKPRVSAGRKKKNTRTVEDIFGPH